MFSKKCIGKISTTECTALVSYKEADSLTKISQYKNKVVDVIEDSNSSTFLLPGESVSDASKRCFAPFEIFGSFDKLKSKVDAFSIEWRFRATCYGNLIHCNHFGKPQKKVENKFSRKSIKFYCPWLIKIKFLDQRKKNSVKIIDIFPHHTNNCTTSKDQMIRTTAGDYGKFTSFIPKDLIKLIDLNHFINSCSICELLQRALQNRKYIRSDDVCNARVRAKLLIKKIKENDHTIDTFQNI